MDLIFMTKCFKDLFFCMKKFKEYRISFSIIKSSFASGAFSKSYLQVMILEVT